MKKYFLSIVALAGMLFATSCQESLVEPQMEGPTTFTVQLPDQMGTKAEFGHANNVDKLLVEVYPAGQTSSSLFQTVAEVKEGKATVALNLIQGQLYDILFWAQKGNNYVQVTKDGNTYSFDNNLTSIPMNDNFLNNDNGAAFFHAEKNFEPSGTPTPITLYRPFAQLNLGTTDASLNTNAGKYTLVRSSISVSGMATTFNAYTGEGEGEQNVTYNFEAANVPTQSLKVGENTYNYVSMNYLSVLGNEKDLLDEVVATIIVKNAAGNEMQPITHTFELVPVQENYRTNIVGNLISSTTDFKVLVDDDFAEEEYNYVAPGIELINGEYVIVSEEGLWSLAEHVNSGTKAINTFAGKTFKLGVDIDLKNQVWTPIGSGFTFEGTFDGQGHTIKNLNVNTPDCAGLFGSVHGTIKDVKVKGAKISSHHYAGTIVGYIYGSVMDCEVSDAIITNTVEEVSTGVYDNGDKTGGIVGYVGENGNYQITRNKVNNVVITGYRDMGGIVGYLKKNILTYNKISDLTLVVDKTQNYKGASYAQTVGAYCGFAGAGSIIESNQGDDYTISVIEENFNIAEQIQNAEVGEVVAIPAGEYGTFPKLNKNITIVCVEGTVFKGTNKLNINGSTVIGATFENENGTAVDQTINGVFENCTFTGSNALRSCYAGENVIFRNCVFDGDVYGVHFDGGANDATFENCVFSGFNAFGGELTQLNLIDCTFKPLGNSSYNGINMWGNTKLENCNFEFDGAHTEWIDAVNNGKKLEFNGCKVNGEPLSIDRVGDYGEGNIIIIDGKYYVKTATSFLKVCTDVLTDGSKNVKVVLGDNINLAGIEWPAIEAKAAFEIDGNGKTISNLNAKNVKYDGFHNVGMFCSTPHGKKVSFKNIIIDQATVVGSGNGGSHGAVLVATPWGELILDNVKITKSTVSKCDRSAILTTYLYFADAQVKDCVVENCTVNSIGTAGALLGMNNSNDFEATGNTVKNTTISSSEGSNKAGILIGTWQKAGTLTESNNVVENSKAINAGTETNNNIGREV